MPDRVNATTPRERLFRGYAGRLYLGMTIAWAALVLGRQILPPLLPAIMDDLAITPALAGAALTVLWALRALAQYPGGRLADRLSRKTVLVCGLGTLAVGFLLLSGATVYPLFLLGAAVVGLGAGAYSVTMRTTTADLFVAKRARAYGIQGAFNNLAGIAAGSGAVLILSIATWRGAFLPIALVLAVGAVGLHAWNRDAYVVERVSLEVAPTFRRLLTRVTVRRVIGAYVLWVFAWLGMIGFLPTFLQVEKGFSTANASAGFALVYVVGMVAGPLSGAVGDRFDKLLVGVGALVLAAAGLGALLLAESLVLVGASVAVLAVGFRSFSPVALAYLMDVFPDDSMGGDLGAARTVWGFIASFGTTYVGLVAGRSSYTVAYLGLIGCLLFSLALLGIVRFGDR